MFGAIVARATGTAGVWQNQPPLPPGRANPADSAATARSQEATSWQPAAVASACTLAITTCGTDWIRFINAVHWRNRSRTPVRSLAATSAKSCPAENTFPNASVSSARWSAASEFRRFGRFMVIRTVSPSRETSRCS